MTDSRLKQRFPLFEKGFLELTDNKQKSVIAAICKQSLSSSFGNQQHEVDIAEIAYFHQREQLILRSVNTQLIPFASLVFLP